MFIITVEGLGRFIKSRFRQGLLKGWSWCNSLPPYSHLQFVDDIALMGMVRINEAINFKILDTFLATSDQKFNEVKSSIFFFNTTRLIQSRIAQILRSQISSLPLVYRGLPLGVGSQCREFWQEVLNKFRKGVSHWTCRRLLSTRRVTLLMSMVQALLICICFMQVAPSSFVKEFNALSHQFLWF